MKILFTADQHITLRKSKVPKSWAENRYNMYFSELANIDHDVLILGGDFFDKKPSIEEVGIFLRFINNHPKPICMIAGNHEATTKYQTFLSALKDVKPQGTSFNLMTDETDSISIDDCIIKFMTYHYIKAGANPPEISPGKKNILITHARGDISFTDPEYDFARFSKYDLVLLGDLHTYHREANFNNVWYPGSPYSITFHKEQIEHGVLVVDTKDLVPVFVPLKLPQLIKLEMKATDVFTIPEDGNCYIAEVTGNAEELGKIARSDTVVRKLEVRNSATLALENLSPIEEVRAVLEHMGIKNKLEIERMFNEIT